MEQKIMIRLTANGFDRQLSMMTDYYDIVEITSSQLDRGLLHEKCYRMRDTLEDKGNITVRRVSACAFIVVNGITFTSARVVENYS